MALAYHPRPGEIVVCHYGNDVIAPEMCKSRPAVVVSPRRRQGGRLVTVVPLSTTEPKTVERHHHQIALGIPLPAPFDAVRMWAKCDLVATVSLDRLDRFKEARDRYGGPRRWRSGYVSAEDLAAIRAAVAVALGLDS